MGETQDRDSQSTPMSLDFLAALAELLAQWFEAEASEMTKTIEVYVEAPTLEAGSTRVWPGNLGSAISERAEHLGFADEVREGTEMLAQAIGNVRRVHEQERQRLMARLELAKHIAIALREFVKSHGRKE